MNPIQTKYKGYKFRSRLEARWAVFLDELNTKWVYEKEGYDLNGVWYLPDFWVEDWDTWIEIKAQAPTEDEWEKCDSLARESDKKVLLISGDPWTENNKNAYDITFFGNYELDQSGFSGWEFGEGRRCSDEIWLMSDSYGALTLRATPHERVDKYPLSGSMAYGIVAALSAARSARFEHGEVGSL